MLWAGYSVWTDTSYKWPLLASAVACIIGNLAYCLSYDTGSLLLLLVGRLVTGFGKAAHPWRESLKTRAQIQCTAVRLADAFQAGNGMLVSCTGCCPAGSACGAVPMSA